jgi:hypothetical protein
VYDKFGPFSALFWKILQNSGAEIHCQPLFQSTPFLLCGRTIGSWQHWIYEQKIVTCRFKCFSRIFGHQKYFKLCCSIPLTLGSARRRSKKCTAASRKETHTIKSTTFLPLFLSELYNCRNNFWRM